MKSKPLFVIIYGYASLFLHLHLSHLIKRDDVKIKHAIDFSLQSSPFTYKLCHKHKVDSFTLKIQCRSHVSHHNQS